MNAFVRIVRCGRTKVSFLDQRTNIHGVSNVVGKMLLDGGLIIPRRLMHVGIEMMIQITRSINVHIS